MTTPSTTAIDTTTTTLTRKETAMTTSTTPSLTNAIPALVPANDGAPPVLDTAPPASAERITVTRDPLSFRPSVLRKPLKSADRRDYAEKELDWLHSPRALDPRNAGRRAVLLAWLARLSAADRGIIALRYDRRVLSPMLAENLYLPTALVVRIDCAAHPMIGTVEAAERASVARLEGLLREGRAGRIAVLERRAFDRFDEAVKAFAIVRENVALVVPEHRQRRTTKTKPDAMGDATG